MARSCSVCPGALGGKSFRDHVLQPIHHYHLIGAVQYEVLDAEA